MLGYPVLPTKFRSHIEDIAGLKGGGTPRFRRTYLTLVELDIHLTDKDTELPRKRRESIFLFPKTMIID
jgi:hypothetical protein